jgi:hypothetical protein
MDSITLKCREILRRTAFSRLARMPLFPLRLLAVGLAGAAALGLVACGGEDAKLLPGETAREITANLDTVQQLATEGDCVGAESAAGQVGEQIEALEGVDHRLKKALEDGAARLEEVIATCEESTTESIAPAVPSEPEEEEEKAPKEGAGKEREPKPAEEEPAPEESKSLPPQAKGEAKGHEKGESPPIEEPEEEPGESASGGVGPGAPAGGGGG